VAPLGVTLYLSKSKFMKAIRIILLLLIIFGTGLLVTQKVWVPKVVAAIMQNDAH